MTRRDSSLSPESFARMLEWLGDTGSGARYEEFRLKLIKFFQWRGCATPAECADITIDRVAARVSEDAVQQQGSGVWPYIHGVAQNVLREYWRQPAMQELDPRMPSAEDVVHQLEVERRAACLQRCLEKLAPESRKLVMDYHQSAGAEKIRGRARTADLLGIPLNALRIRMYRLRARLEVCVERCTNREMNREIPH